MKAKPKKPQIPVWEWTKAIAKADVPPPTKLVCLNIARYLSDAAKGWVITIKQMILDTNLSNTTIVLHIANAEAAGLLTKVELRNGAGHRSGTKYTPAFPTQIDCALHEAPSPREGRLSELGDVPDEAPSPSPSEAPSRHIEAFQVKTFHSSHNKNSPPPPQRGARARDSKNSYWIAQLYADGMNAYVVEHLIAPLLSGLNVEHEDPLGLLRDIRDQRAIADLPARVLARLAIRLKETRKKLISTKDVVDALPDACRGMEMLRLFPESPSWWAWCRRLEESGVGAMIRYYNNQGYMRVWTEWPPGHRNGERITRKPDILDEDGPLRPILSGIDSIH